MAQRTLSSRRRNAFACTGQPVPPRRDPWRLSSWSGRQPVHGDSSGPGDGCASGSRGPGIQQDTEIGGMCVQIRANASCRSAPCRHLEPCRCRHPAAAGPVAGAETRSSPKKRSPAGETRCTSPIARALREGDPASLKHQPEPCRRPAARIPRSPVAACVTASACGSLSGRAAALAHTQAPKLPTTPLCPSHHHPRGASFSRPSRHAYVYLWHHAAAPCRECAAQLISMKALPGTCLKALLFQKPHRTAT